MSMSYVDDGGKLLPILDDHSMLDLAKQLSKVGVLDVYVEILDTRHVKKLPKILMFVPEFIRDGKNAIDGGEISDCSIEVSNASNLPGIHKSVVELAIELGVEKGRKSMVDGGDTVASSKEFT